MEKPKFYRVPRFSKNKNKTKRTPVKSEFDINIANNFLVKVSPQEKGWKMAA